jgi:NAD-dependent SIR2 family protein deacetylase
MQEKLDDEQWDRIIEKIKDGCCVPFLGAGASMGFEGPGLPNAKELAKELAVKCGYKGLDQEDFLRVCQYYELKKDAADLRRFIIARLKSPNIRPGKVHRTLAKLPLTHIITTNYDVLMETALLEENKQPVTVVHNIRRLRTAPKLRPGTVQAPVVYKLHGSVEDPTSMICTEDDMVQFVARVIHEEPGLPASIKELFQTCSFLFIGYGLRDWNVRVMIRAMRWAFPLRDWTTSFAIQRRPSDAGFADDWENSVMYWNRKEQIECYDKDVLEFMSELGARYEASDQPVGAQSNVQPSIAPIAQPARGPSVEPGIPPHAAAGPP